MTLVSILDWAARRSRDVDYLEASYSLVAEAAGNHQWHESSNLILKVAGEALYRSLKCRYFSEERTFVFSRYPIPKLYTDLMAIVQPSNGTADRRGRSVLTGRRVGEVRIRRGRE